MEFHVNFRVKESACVLFFLYWREFYSILDLEWSDTQLGRF